MNPRAACLVCTRDDAFMRRVAAYAGETARVRRIGGAPEAIRDWTPAEPAVLLLDLRSPAWREVLAAARAAGAESAAVIAAGVAGSDPLREAEALGVYAVCELTADGRRLRELMARAQDRLELARENGALRARLARAWAERPAAEGGGPGPGALRFQYFSGAFRHFDDVNAMLDSMVRDIAGLVHASRVGVFAAGRAGLPYTLRAGARCFEGTPEIRVPADDPLVRWMRVQARFASRGNLDGVTDDAERGMLAGWLDILGAEVLVPLHGRNRLLGWLFLGPRVTGTPFGPADLADLMPLGEHVSIALENALLYREAAFQRTFAETALHAIPAGIVAVDEQGLVRWMNRSAPAIMDVRPEDVLGRPAARLGSRLADLLTRALAREAGIEQQEWIDKATRRALAVSAARLEDGAACLGAVAVLRDVSEEIRLREQRGKLERDAFWTELAAAMSHEIRNPLVAISTFAQLLPERYADEEFRGEFSALVRREIARLNKMIDQVDAFANPPEPAPRAVAAERVLKKAAELAAARAGAAGAARVEFGGAAWVPPLVGDEAALTETFAHLLQNALEAVEGASEPRVAVTCGRSRMDDGRDALLIRVQDNGRGIPAPIETKIFSPFCTTKARGIGLGLPIAKRTVTDHGGRLTVETGARGTCVAVLLPAAPGQPKESHETDPGC
ncbi:MAG: PAS domain-containing protein [Lentisphaerae bacterium]|nr:PAS domain-containing protein [Lentisphaerota bacterium]